MPAFAGMTKATGCQALYFSVIWARKQLIRAEKAYADRY
jgi:hypothetical protein